VCPKEIKSAVQADLNNNLQSRIEQHLTMLYVKVITTFIVINLHKTFLFG